MTHPDMETIADIHERIFIEQTDAGHYNEDTMHDIEHLRATLSSLKIGAKEKRYHDPIPSDGCATSCGYMLTCCIENRRLMLAVSLDHPNALDPNLFTHIMGSIFGQPLAIYTCEYPIRGTTTIFQWLIDEQQPSSRMES